VKHVLSLPGLRARHDDTLVLCYHAVGDLHAGGVVPPRELAWQLETLLGRGYRSGTFSEVVRGAAHGGRALAVTFDDGYASVITDALPILTRLGLVGTVFPRLDRLGQAGSLTSADLVRLRDAGWEIGSHTLTHPQLTALDDRSLEHELRESKHRLEAEIGAPCSAIAYPRGEADRRVVAAAAAVGYEAGAALLGVPVCAAGPLAWPRVGVDGRDGRLMFRLRVSRPLRFLRRSRLGARTCQGRLPGVISCTRRPARCRDRAAPVTTFPVARPGQRPRP
jgi:peptidoglycan/xylan/chitin deacetylase (PgdA/CDA1 family)